MNETEVGILACERMRLPLSEGLRMQTYIPTALHNLALQVANDPRRRPLLMTDPADVAITVTPGQLDPPLGGVLDATVSETGYVDLASYISYPDTSLSSYELLLEAIQIGTIFHQYVFTFVAGDVTFGSAWPNGSLIDVPSAYETLVEGEPVYYTTSGTPIGGTTQGTKYYVLTQLAGGTASYLNFAISEANVASNTGITFTDAGVDGGIIYQMNKQTLQWLQSPTQGASETCLPFPILQGWLENTILRLKGIKFVNTATADSILRFNVPYIPTLRQLPTQLEDDLVDIVVGIALTGNPEMANEESQK